MASEDTAVDADIREGSEDCTDDEDVSESKPSSPVRKPSPRPRKWTVRHARKLAVAIVASVVVVALMAAAGGVLWWVRAQHDHQERDAAITVAAREHVLALLSLDPDNVRHSLDRVLAGATGGWRAEFAKEADQFTEVVRTGKVRANASISSSAIQNASDDRATVLVSANATIRNADSPDGYPAVYRVLMILESQDGKWLVSDLQFVA